MEYVYLCIAIVPMNLLVPMYTYPKDASMMVCEYI